MKQRKLGWTILAYGFAVFYLLPVIIAVLNSFKDRKEILISAISLPKSLYLENYKVVLNNTHFLKVFLNSIYLTLASILLIMIISSLAGYSFARWRRKLADLLLMLFLSSMFVPFHTIMIPLLQTAKELGATGKVPGMILIYGGLMCPLTIFLYRGFIKAIPLELEEAAIIDGCGMLSLILRIVIPLLKPISGTVAILNAMWIWNDFLLPYLVLAKPLTIPLSQMYFYGQYNQQWNLIMAGFVISTLPLVIFFLFMQKFIIKGLVSGALKS